MFWEQQDRPGCWFIPKEAIRFVTWLIVSYFSLSNFGWVSYFSLFSLVIKISNKYRVLSDSKQSFPCGQISNQSNMMIYHYSLSYSVLDIHMKYFFSLLFFWPRQWFDSKFSLFFIRYFVIKNIYVNIDALIQSVSSATICNSSKSCNKKNNLVCELFNLSH